MPASIYLLSSCVAVCSTTQNDTAAAAAKRLSTAESKIPKPVCRSAQEALAFTVADEARTARKAVTESTFVAAHAANLRVRNVLGQA